MSSSNKQLTHSLGHTCIFKLREGKLSPPVVQFRSPNFRSPCHHGSIYVTIGIVEVREYIQADGVSPYKRWFDELDAKAAAKVASAAVKISLGNLSSIKWFDGIGEYKIDWGPGYRIYLAKDGKDLIILFGGGIKKRQNDDIAEALRLHEEYKVRKKTRNKLQDAATETTNARRKRR